MSPVVEFGQRAFKVVLKCLLRGNGEYIKAILIEYIMEMEIDIWNYICKNEIVYVRIVSG